ncbi:MAG: hypothetical protein ACR2JI_09085 [Mycobacterium sp.]
MREPRLYLRSLYLRSGVQLRHGQRLRQPGLHLRAQVRLRSRLYLR